MKLILVRHGEADDSRRYWGKTDTELTAKGREQAAKLGRYLKNEKIDAVYASTLKRVLDTAEAITANHKFEIIKCPELDEVNFGQLEGLTFEEICQSHPDLAAKWAESSHLLDFPDGDNFESFSQRVADFLKRLEGHSDGETVLVVGHGGSFRLLLCYMLGLDLKHWCQFNVKLASVSVMEGGVGTAILYKLSDVSHL